MRFKFGAIKFFSPKTVSQSEFGYDLKLKRVIVIRYFWPSSLKLKGVILPPLAK